MTRNDEDGKMGAGGAGRDSESAGKDMAGSRVRADLVRWMRGPAEFPAVEPYSMPDLPSLLCEMLVEFGMDALLGAIGELEAELNGKDCELPDYYRRELADSALSKGIGEFHEAVHALSEYEEQRAAEEAMRETRRAMTRE